MTLMRAEESDRKRDRRDRSALYCAAVYFDVCMVLEQCRFKSNDNRTLWHYFKKRRIYFFSLIL